MPSSCLLCSSPLLTPPLRWGMVNEVISFFSLLTFPPSLSPLVLPSTVSSSDLLLSVPAAAVEGEGRPCQLTVHFHCLPSHWRLAAKGLERSGSMRPRTLDEEEESMERGMMKKMGGADDWRQKRACHFYALKG